MKQQTRTYVCSYSPWLASSAQMAILRSIGFGGAMAQYNQVPL